MSPVPLPPRQLTTLAFMSGHGYVTASEVSRHLRTDYASAQNALIRLTAKGLAEVSDTARPTCRAWQITTAGEEVLAAEMTREQ